MAAAADVDGDDDDDDVIRWFRSVTRSLYCIYAEVRLSRL